MTQKIKSLIYLSCFVFAAIVYNGTIKDTTIQLSDKAELSETNAIADSNTKDLEANTIN